MHITFLKQEFIDFKPPSKVAYDCVFCMLAGTLYPLEALKFIWILSKSATDYKAYFKYAAREKIKQVLPVI